jgi:hypothetical protein
MLDHHGQCLAFWRLAEMRSQALLAILRAD